MAIIKSNRRPQLGDTPATPAIPSVSDIIDNPTVKTGAGVALAYHGYKRTGSIAWALFYGFMGRWFPLEAVPIAAAQGFAQPKKGCP